MRPLELAIAGALLLVASETTAYEQEVNRISASIAERISTAGKTRVAVVDFTDLQGNVTELGRFLAEEFSVSLAEAGKSFEVVDRTHLKSILEEHKLATTGLIDPATARQLGKLAGVEALVTGTLTEFGDSVRVAVKVLDTETAGVINASRGNVAKTQAIQELLGIAVTGSDQKSSQPAPKPASRTSVQQSKEVKGFRFDLKRCKGTEQQIVCEFLITQIGQDEHLFLYARGTDPPTRAFDFSGNEYQAQTVSVVGERNERYVGYRFVSGVPTKAGLIIGEVPREVTTFAVLDFAVDSWRVEFRNVSLER